MKVVIDTNIIISGIFWGGNPGKLLNAIEIGEIELHISDELLTEYIEVIFRVGNNRELSKKWNVYFLNKCRKVKVTKTEVISRDPKDDFILALAKKAKVDYIISGDKDITEIKEFEIPIIKVGDFLKILYPKKI